MPNKTILEVFTDNPLTPEYSDKLIIHRPGDLQAGAAALFEVFEELGRFVSVASYGAVGDGVTDDTAAIQAAFTALGNGPGIVYSPFTSHKISSTIQIGNGTTIAKSTINAIGFVGRGGTVSAISAGDGGGTKLLWYGAAGGGPVIKVNGPITNVLIENFQIDCKPAVNGAATGIHVYHCHNGVFRRITITNYSGVGLDVDALGDNALPAGVVIGGDDCIFERVDCAGVQGNNAVGLRLGPGGNGTVSDNARNSFYNCWFWGSDHANGIGLHARFADNCSFYQCGFQAGIGQRAIYVDAPVVATAFPGAFSFYNCFTVGTITSSGTWAPTHGFAFYGLSTTDGGVIPSGLSFYGRDTEGKFFGPSIFNENGFDVDFRVESDNKTHMFFLDASTDRIGIYTSAPSCALDISDVGLTGVAKGFRILDNTTGHGIREYIDTAAGAAYKGTPGLTDLHIQTNSVDRIDIAGAGGITINESGADADFRIEGDTEANLFFIDASTDRIGIGTSTPGNKVHIFAAATSDALISAGTDAANGPCLNFGYGGASFSRGACFFNARQDAGAVSPEPSIRFLTKSVERIIITDVGNVGIGTSSFGTNAVGVLSIKNGTAPTTGVADTVQYYSSDNSAGNTIPSFYCEGTEVLATGQADSASSVRVKMRINGTVCTFLCI